jgi:hypothetical protein
MHVIGKAAYVPITQLLSRYLSSHLQPAPTLISSNTLVVHSIYDLMYCVAEALTQTVELSFAKTPYIR